MLPGYSCSHFSKCDEFTGRCTCPAGFGGEDCSQPVCGGLSDGEHRLPRQGDSCQCKAGWEGIHCNICTQDDACLPLVPTNRNATCFRGGLVVKANHQMCNVTNKKILDMLPDRPPQVTFSCEKKPATCNFQFWIKEVESFYCALDKCAFSQNPEDAAQLSYECKHIQCRCKPGAMLCGEDGGIDLSDFLTDKIKGPASFNCEGAHCKFEEPEMNQLILSIFGDAFIGLDCKSGECLHYTQVPGFKRSPRQRSTPLMAVSIVAVVLLLVAGVAGVLAMAKRQNEGMIRLSDADDSNGGSQRRQHHHRRHPSADDENGKLMADHTPATLSFREINYFVAGQQVLNNVLGTVQPGELMAIMGASGAGKTSLLDILARRNKSGEVQGELFVNGKTIDNETYRRVIGYVDQEDTLMPTLTVYETILYSALLRLPAAMSTDAKHARVMDAIHELGIHHIRNRRIGESGARGISGGEKRRVSIACELVTSPAILFLDEPTSGLDAYNAHNVVECLRTLARDYRRTIVFTIHQPRSDIYAMFDRLVLLADGWLVYSGNAHGARNHFAQAGHPCPLGYNVADFLVDITKSNESTLAVKQPQSTMHGADMPHVAMDNEPGSSNGGGGTGGDHDADEQAPLLLNPRATSDLGHGHRQSNGGDFYAPPAMPPYDSDEEIMDIDDEPRAAAYWENSLSSNPWASAKGSRSKRPASMKSTDTTLTTGRPGDDAGVVVMSAHLKQLVKAYRRSVLARQLLEDIERQTSGHLPASTVHGEPFGVEVPSFFGMTAPRRSSYWTQFCILSNRTFKNLYRNPYLMLTHYGISLFLAVFCGLLFYNVTNDISGFQNRMGLFFFVCALFGFSCLTSLQVFSAERILFVRERANGYYSPITYFVAKVLFDIIPLRVMPPILLGLVVYHMVGLVPGIGHFAKFLLVLVIFNLTAASICLLLGVLFRDISIANLLASLVMLFSMLFGGLLLNKESIPVYLRWLKHLSFFNYAFEALIVNEMVYLQLTEKKYGLEIDVPGATILSTFGFDASAFWSDVIKLSVMCASCLVAAYLGLLILVRERR
ncbi:LOW QUALITY PROTEIN: hypothetical protein SYNPS1DRAFT_32331 [Syncephalis pseudoplumigaleata]|uniref:ABC transporter domain-containing protein n=1 Tax=Syncephalis pseudoplumigaleata TaxID=1712513 RepID=A0A4P9Z5J1_9FUNG|nr:LOW QUALITY PROTEIN: hypothetical protein SYNPS1DRAFT_32331 [Syncephalis pseudoplumigaleata]|eukprot:RKP27887.1 LOW QUALITY PROTEIN: hypothetical protein SYNPS1DRAFT_32331 [Syncephalis pseudoplumigaleata]